MKSYSIKEFNIKIDFDLQENKQRFLNGNFLYKAIILVKQILLIDVKKIDKARINYYWNISILGAYFFENISI